MSTHSDALNPVLADEAVLEPRDHATRFLIAGLVLLAVAMLGVLNGPVADPARPFLGWLLAASFWLSILIGMQFLVLIWWMFDAGWPVIIRRQIEHALAAFSWVGLAMLPLLALAATGHASTAWTWMNPDAPVAGGHGTVADDILYLHKQGFLNKPFFFIRFALYFGIWIGLSQLLRGWSFAMDASGDHKYVHRSRRLAAVGLFLCAFATTFASIDWFKSINYHWFSTMFGVWFFSGSMRAALSVIVLLLFWQADRGDGLKGIVKPVHFHRLGCIMLAFTVFWAYIAFSQYFLIYNANIPEETFWYNIRELGKGGGYNAWWYAGLALVFLHFLLPFLYLLFYRNKFGNRLRFIAAWILLFHLLDLYWNVLPEKLPTSGAAYVVRPFTVGWVDAAALLGVGALAIYAFLRSAATYRPIPIRDPRVAESIHCHE
jgi:hypothetical protein